MIVALELVAEFMMMVKDGDFFAMEMRVNHVPVTGGYGCDQYQVSGLILGGKRVAGTGREQEYNWKNSLMGLGGVEAVPARGVPVEFDPHNSRMRLHIRTNAVLDVGILQAQFCLHWRDAYGGLVLDLPLRSPQVEIDWAGRGDYKLDLTPFARDLWRRAQKSGSAAAGGARGGRIFTA